MLMTGMMKASLESRIADLEGACRRLEQNLSVLTNQTGSYAQEPRILLTTYRAMIREARVGLAKAN